MEPIKTVQASSLGWRLSVLGFVFYATFDAYLLFRVHAYCESSNCSNWTLFYVALVPTVAYVLGMPLFLAVYRKQWSVWRTVVSCLIGGMIQLAAIVACLIPSYT